MDSEVIVAIIGAVFASSGLWGLLQYLITRKDKTGEKIDKLTVLVQEISERQTLEEIDTYEGYCAKHPDFKNNACGLAIEHIRRVYSHLQDSRGFIQ